MHRRTSFLPYQNVSFAFLAAYSFSNCWFNTLLSQCLRLCQRRRGKQRPYCYAAETKM